MFRKQVHNEETETVSGKTESISMFSDNRFQPNLIVAVLVISIRMLLFLTILLGLAGAGAVLGIAKGYMETAPALNLALLDEQDKTSFFYDTDGNVITDYKGTENRVMIGISQMPEQLRNAFVAVEDARFYTHNGIDLKRIAGSFLTNLVSGSQQGGSTITQQLIKNTVLTSELSYKRKIQEAYLAMQLEQKYSKLEILEYYLNTIFLGENYYGVYVAAEGYFSREPSELTLRECAMLAGLTSNPYYYNPRRNFYTRTSETTDYTAITNDRTDYVLRCMFENQFITRHEYEAALDPSTANVTQTSIYDEKGIYPYPHYVEYAVEDVVKVFLSLNNLEDTPANRNKMENKLRTGGYHITLAIDTQIQKIVEDTLENWGSYPATRDPSDKVYKARNSDGTYTEIIQPQAAAVVLDYRTGEIKAIVGGRTHPIVKKSLNRAVDINMPVGSSIKPLSAYAPAIERGASPASIVYNMPIPIAGWKDGNGKDSWPSNYGGGSYTGAETFRTALKYSHNTSAAQALLSYSSVDYAASLLQKMGVSEKHIDKTPFGLSLGSSGLTPLEMATAYSVLANAGMYQSPISILGISDSSGNVIWDAHASQQRYQVFRPATAWLTIDMMKSVVSSGNSTAAQIKGQTVAGKTGTNSDNRGITFSGITGWYVSSIWVGHDNYKPLSSKTTGSRGALPIWQSYMSKIHKEKGLQNRDIIEASPEDLGLIKVTTCAVSGQLATDACRNDSMGYGTVTDYWYSPTAPNVYCQIHQTVTICNDSGCLATQFCPSTRESASVVIPSGHPLYELSYSNEYGEEIAQYLGTYQSMVSCPYHTSAASSGWQSSDSDISDLIEQARSLLNAAYSAAAYMDTYSMERESVITACATLENVISGYNPAPESIYSAMNAVSKALNQFAE